MLVIQANTMLNLHKQQHYLGRRYAPIIIYGMQGAFLCLNKTLWCPILVKESFTVGTPPPAAQGVQSYSYIYPGHHHGLWIIHPWQKVFVIGSIFWDNTQISVFIIIITTQITSEMSLKMLPTIGSCCTLILSRFFIVTRFKSSHQNSYTPSLYDIRWLIMY